MINDSNLVKQKANQKVEEENIAKLSTLYNQGLTSDNKIDHSHLYNIVVTILSLISAISVGVIVCYLIYVFC